MKLNNSYLTIMKKIFLILLVGLFVAMAGQSAHTYHPFVAEGKRWLCWEGAPNNIFMISGDTIFENKSFKKILHRYPDLYNDDIYHDYAIVREEGKKVYIVYEGESEEMLLYDFSLGIINGSVEIANGEKYICKYAENISTETSNQGVVERRKITFLSTFDTENEWDSSVLMEGIGMRHHPFRPYGQVPNNQHKFDYEIIEVDENDKMVFNGADWLSSYNYYAYMRGEVNGDEIIDVEDVNAIIGFILRDANPEWDDVSADCNKDQILDVEDINFVINKILKVN